MVNANGMGELGSIRDRRRTLGLSQQRLAEAAGCSLSMVRLLEAGYVPSPDSAVAARIAAALRRAHASDQRHNPPEYAEGPAVEAEPSAKSAVAAAQHGP